MLQCLFKAAGVGRNRLVNPYLGKIKRKEMNDKKMMPILQINGTDVPLEASWGRTFEG